MVFNGKVLIRGDIAIVDDKEFALGEVNKKISVNYKEVLDGI
jgi:hypothetical protein